MRSNFYQKTAFGNIKKNARFFIPRILIEAGLLCCFYIVLTLSLDKRLSQVPGGSYIPTFMFMGVIVTVILSVILMLYTNSFLMKQRKREFGLYNVLGMEKRHIGKVLFHESFISSIAGMVLGIVAGILFYKLGTLIICRILISDVVMGFYYINAGSVIPAILIFLGLDLFTFIVNLISIARLKPVEMLKSTQLGEKEPKVKWPLFVIGLGALGAGYYLSISAKNGVMAMGMFFPAVFLVILGTYFLFVAGSIFVLKMMKRNKNYYYNRKHMPVVSGMLYRMKQNAVGLASICILATFVLVMISTTISLYVGVEDTLKSNYPQHYYIGKNIEPNAIGSKSLAEYDDTIIAVINEAAEKSNIEIKEVVVTDYLEVAYLSEEEGVFSYDQYNANTVDNISQIAAITFVTPEQYNMYNDAQISLSDDEIMFYSMENMKIHRDTIVIGDCRLKNAGALDSFHIVSEAGTVVDCYGMVVTESTLNKLYEAQKSVYEYYSEAEHSIGVVYANVRDVYSKGFQMDRDIKESIKQKKEVSDNSEQLNWNFSKAVWEARENALGMNGTLLFLGLLLGTIFIFSTALIIYYKQISEGYEDRNRFQIMEKVGMSNDEVKKTISQQIILVFFLPLVVAGIHLAAAFPLLDKMLHLLLMTSDSIFILCSGIVFVVFTVIYVLIYSATAKTYYKIVH